jgi:hypothetical protein
VITVSLGTVVLLEPHPAANTEAPAASATAAARANVEAADLTP